MFHFLCHYIKKVKRIKNRFVFLACLNSNHELCIALKHRVNIQNNNLNNKSHGENKEN